MRPNLVYASGINRTLPHDLQRHIMTKFISTAERRDYSIYTMYADQFKENLKVLPQSVLVKLFVNGIYNKCQPLLGGDEYTMRTGSGTRKDRIRRETLIGPFTQHLQVWLDTLYYGFRLRSGNEGDQAGCYPSYAINVRDPNPNKLTFIPTEGHCELTDHIHVDDFVRFIHMFIHLGEPPNKIRNMNNRHMMPLKSKKYKLVARDCIMYDLSVIVKFLADKYRHIRREYAINVQLLKQQLIVSREATKQTKLAQREAAKQTKLAQREAAKQTKLAQREAAKTARNAERKQTQIIKNKEKEQEKRELKQLKLEERLSKKLAKR